VPEQIAFTKSKENSTIKPHALVLVKPFTSPTIKPITAKAHTAIMRIVAIFNPFS
jgi:hypothetical protein